MKMIDTYRPATHVAALLLATCSSGALAQDGDRVPPRDDILVVGRGGGALDRPSATGSRLGLTPLELPASVATVDGDAIRARGDLTVVEAVSRAPGITAAANAGNGNTALAARGFVGQGSVLQLVDGIRLFPVAGTITFPTDPWTVERIEVLTGPASVLYGQGALGGAVNVVSRAPSESARDDAELSYGAQDTWHVAAGTGGPLVEQLGYRLDASYRRSDGWVDRGDNHSLALSGALRFAPSERLTVMLRGDYGDVTPMRYWGTPLIDGRLDSRNRRRNYNVADADIRFRDDRQTLVAEWKVSDAVTLTNAAYRLASKRSWYDLESYAWAPAAGRPNGVIERSDNLGIVQDIAQYGDQASVKLSAPLGGGLANDLVLGAEVNRVNLRYSNNFAVADQADAVDPFDFAPGTLEDRAATLPRYRTITTEWSIFGEDRLRLSRRLSLVGGFRYEEDGVRRRNILYDAAGAPAGEANAFSGGAREKRFRDATWRVGTVYQPAQSISLYAQYATGVDPVGTLTTFTTSATQFAFTNAKGDQIEAGAKAALLGGRVNVTLAGYRIVKNDLVAQRVTNGPLEQIGRQSSKGIEAALLLALAAGFSIEANGTVLDARFDDLLTGDADLSSNTPPDVPERAGNLWLTWESRRGVRAQAGLRHVGARFVDSTNSARVPAYTVADGGLSFALTPALAADVRVYNLFDTRYVTSTYGAAQWLLGRPRSLDVALRARL
ncbi:TonB-dependent siderophore receptor [Sphingomonas sp. BK069]|uniref:TonB-dependent receptor n=1 Tax=Sphingomonas sp. BK069 TaxID=2586979 RepID=UPI00161EE6A1|nr:TonB-dependent siderophore receptor [Sphingomonas sp. BK069]MBB3347251.1 iron complex outermembrane receptor protein [Sphingomonas sp. BK069]